MLFAMFEGVIRTRGEYGFREGRSHISHLEHVRVLEHVRGNKWKGNGLIPTPALLHYADSAQLLCSGEIAVSSSREGEPAKAQKVESGQKDTRRTLRLRPRCMTYSRALVRKMCRKAAGEPSITVHLQSCE
jgi:hypothetical protein